MITRVSPSELKQLEQQKGFIAALKYISSLSPHGYREPELWKETAPTRTEKNGGTLLIDEHEVTVTATHVKTIPDFEKARAREGRNPLFIRTPYPELGVYDVSIGNMVYQIDAGYPIEDAYRRTVVQVHYIEPRLQNSYLLLYTKKELGLLGVTPNDPSIYHREVGLNIPFFEGRKKIHRTCEEHGHYKPEKPYPRILLEGAVWMSPNLEPLE